MRLAVRVHPGARRPGLLGRLGDGTLKVAVAVPPEGGRANAALSELLAERLGVKKRQVTVVRGLTARSKVVEIEGLEGAELARRLEQALGRETSHGE
ncbi:MAG: DUF167 domain-containing protein [Candidatus Eisenbacteria bacterium]|nr:DUF167 domain-containing protein [Candidatus Eisenbacteria bacterium]